MTKLTTWSGHTAGLGATKIEPLGRTDDEESWKVQGPRDRRSHTVTRFTQKGGTAIFCSCPMNRYEGECKHVIAVERTAYASLADDAATMAEVCSDCDSAGTGPLCRNHREA